MYLIHKQHITRLQIGQDRGQITRTLQNRPRRRAKTNAQFTRHNLRERGLPKTRRAMKQNMIHRLSPRPRRTNKNAQILPQTTLPREIIQRLRPQRNLSPILLKPGGGGKAIGVGHGGVGSAGGPPPNPRRGDSVSPDPANTGDWGERGTARPLTPRDP